MKSFFKLLILWGLGSFNLAFGQQCTDLVSAEMCQKIGQLFIVGFGAYQQNAQGKVTWNDNNGTVFKEQSYIAKDIADSHIGGVVYFRNTYRDKFTNEFVRDRNLVNAAQVTALSKALQNFNHQSRQQQKLPEIPLFIATDEEGGYVNALTFVKRRNYTAQSLGTNQAIHADDAKKRQQALDFTLQFAGKTSRLLHQYGINLNFSPLVDLNINPVNPIIGAMGRSYSDDPQIVADQAAQVIKALKQAHVVPVLKHFPGQGSTFGDTHTGLVDATSTYEQDKELTPYKILINQGYDDVIMSTHAINGQIDKTQCRTGDTKDSQTWCPATMSYKTITELLRNQLHFKGIIISDDMAMAAITSHYPLETTLEKALNAGIDMFIVANHNGDHTPEFALAIAHLIKTGKVPASRIEDAYQRIVAFKQRHI